MAAFLQVQTIPEATTTHDMVLLLHALLTDHYGAETLQALMNAQPVPTLAEIAVQLTELPPH